jgi:hypothetical protein
MEWLVIGIAFIISFLFVLIGLIMIFGTNILTKYGECKLVAEKRGWLLVLLLFVGGVLLFFTLLYCY